MPRNSTGIETTADSTRAAVVPIGTPRPTYRGRFAPSPTGPLHFGSMLAAAGSWLDARARGGEWLLRIEDLDPPREPPGAIDAILGALEAFGLWWDGPVLYQSHRLQAYEEGLERLRESGWAYPCSCSRKDVALANRRLGRTGRRYPGTCRDLAAPRRKTKVMRVRTGSESLGIDDRLQGRFAQRLEHDVGDFVVRRREGYFAYQLAVVLDDAEQGITDVVRGIDLLDSTPRQLWLQQLLGLPSPRYGHLPVVALPDGRKLSKQTGAAAVDTGRAPEVAWRILSCLEHAPPATLRGAPPAELWGWATAHWDPARLAGRRRIPAP